jgi:hypothetical protein
VLLGEVAVAVAAVDCAGSNFDYKPLLLFLKIGYVRSVNNENNQKV